MKSNSLIKILFVIALLGCTRQRDKFDTSDVQFLTSRVWNIDLSDTINRAHLPDHILSLYRSKFKDAPLFFENGILYFGNLNGEQDSCVFLHDTILLTRRYLRSSYGSMIHVLDTIFMGKIAKLNNDSLEIIRINDLLFNFIFGDINGLKTIRCYNDSLILRKETSYKTISLSCGLCFGTCPMQAVEVDSRGRLHFFGGANAYKRGYYKGQMDVNTIDTIKHLLSAGLLNKPSFKYYGIIDDSQNTEMKIILENNDLITIDGDTWDYNYRLWQLCQRLWNSIRIDSLEKDTVRYMFLSNKYINVK